MKQQHAVRRAKNFFHESSQQAGHSGPAPKNATLTADFGAEILQEQNVPNNRTVFKTHTGIVQPDRTNTEQVHFPFVSSRCIHPYFVRQIIPTPEIAPHSGCPSKRVQTAAIRTSKPQPAGTDAKICSAPPKEPDLPWQPYFSSIGTMIFAKPSHRS